MAFNDSQIINGPTGSVPFTPNPLYQWSTNYFATTTAGTLTYSGLVRGMQYSLRCIGMSTQVSVSARTQTPATWTSLAGVNFATPIPLAPSCASFSYVGVELTAAYKDMALNYCQRYFSTQTSGVVNPACIVCADSRQKYPTGVSFTPLANTTCQVNATAWKSSKLRFLGGSRRSLQNTSNTSNTTNVTPVVVTYTYNLCPVQDLVCGSDTIGAAGNYAAYIASFIGTLNTAAGWQTLTGKANIPITGTPSVLTDAAVPVLNFTAKASVWIWSNTNPAAFNLTLYNPTQVFCWWMQGSSNQALTATQIQTCNSTTVNCGNVTITPTGASITNTISAAPAWSTDLNIWLQCVNNIPMSSQFANVTSGYAWNTGLQPGTTNVTNTTNLTNNTNVTNNTNTTNQTKGAGSYISYGIALLISLVFIL
jgi:hypothetical protein